MKMPEIIQEDEDSFMVMKGEEILFECHSFQAADDFLEGYLHAIEYGDI
jgi:hypothetical protein